MSRIRSIHPGLWTDEAFVSLSPLARLLFIGMWNECDDKGTFPWSPLKLKMRVLPADNADPATLLSEIEAAGLIRSYSFGDKTFGAVKNFTLYQRPKKPNDIHPASAEILRFAGMSEELASQQATLVPNQFRTGGEMSPQREEGGGNRSSEADASGADAPNLSAIDVKKVVFDTGRMILMEAGDDERAAGSFIGRLRGMYSDSQMLVVLSRCQVEQPSDPKAWLTKALQTEQSKCAGNNRNGQSSSPDEIQNPYARYAARREAERSAAVGG